MSSAVRLRTFYLKAGCLSELPLFGWERANVGELSLPGEPECLSLQNGILPQEEKSGNGQLHWWHFLPRREQRGSMTHIIEIALKRLGYSLLIQSMTQMEIRI